MNEEQAIRRAVQEEEWFHDFYARAALEAPSISAKRLFSTLAHEEQLHKEKLLTIDTNHLPRVELRDPAIAETLMLTPIDELPGLHDTFDYAIQSEKLAQKRYAAMAKASTEPRTKELFMWLVAEEKRHQKLLESELANVKP